MSPTQLFHCPTCGAGLPVPEDDKASVRCEYCNSTVLVPAEYRTTKPKAEPQPYAAPQQPVVINLGSSFEPAAQAAASTAGCAASLVGWLVFSVVILVIIGVVLVATGTLGAISGGINEIVSIQTQVSNLPGSNSVQETADAILGEMGTMMPGVQTTPTGDPLYEALLAFGAAGSGAGQFEDARNMAVDREGNIYVAEMEAGRVQKFGPDGKFLQMVNVPPDKAEYTTISDMAADLSGKLYIARRGSILIYNTADMSLVNTIPAEFPDTWYSVVHTDAANNLYAFHTSAGELDVIKWDAAGQQLFRKVQIMEGLHKKTEISSVDQMAVDGAGNIFLIDRSLSQVFQFDPQGTYVDRFGSKEELSGPDNILVDGQGRVYIPGFTDIKVYNTSGKLLYTLPGFWESALRDFALDLEGNLYLLTTEPQVHKVKLLYK